jgi:formyl-CoA transferase
MLGSGAFPLRGYRVVDVSQMWAGPQLATTLGDMGAEVIRVESRAGTDAGRFMGRDKSEYGRLLDSQRYYRSRDYYVAINLAAPAGLRLFKEIIKTADVFVCNLAPRALTKLHITYEELRPLRPDLVMAAISAAGRDGPADAGRAGGIRVGPAFAGRP